MKPLEQIIVGIDFSDPCVNALREAARMAKWTGAELTAIHVVDLAALETMASQVDLKKVDVAERAAERLEDFVEQHLQLKMPINLHEAKR